MRCQLSSDGTLNIQADNGAESYALRQWCRSFQEKDGQSRISVTYEPESCSMFASVQINTPSTETP